LLPDRYRLRKKHSVELVTPTAQLACADVHGPRYLQSSRSMLAGVVDRQAGRALLATLAWTGASVQFAVDLRADGRDRKMSSERAGTRLSAQPYDPCSICGADGGQQHLPRDSSPILTPPPPPTPTAPRDSGSEAWIAYADVLHPSFIFVPAHCIFSRICRRSHRTRFTMWDGFFMLLALSAIMGIA
jgi:hypothetical protein